MALRPIPITARTKNTLSVTKPVNTPITQPAPNPAVSVFPTGTQTVQRPRVQQNFGLGSAEGGAVTPRQSPTVATPNQPVISKTLNNSLVYDPSNPEDYLMKLQARTTTGKTPTEQEYYQALQAQKALQASNGNQVNPLQSTLDELTKQQQLLKSQETTSDANQLDAYRTQLDQQYGQQRDELLASGERQRGAAQNVYSFSGFGRSTAAADKMVEIQKGTDSAINVLNAAKQAAIAAKQAELNGADSETLAALNARVQQYQDQANKRQIDSLKATADANQSSGASYIESLNNLMATASKSGMDIGNPQDIQIYAQMARNPDGTINEEFVSALPQGMQSIIRTANIQQSKEAPKIENFGTTKSPRYMQRDGAKRVPVSGAGGGSMGGGGGGGAGTGGVGAIAPSSQATDILNDPNLSKSVGGWSVLGNVPGTPQYDFQKKVDNYVNNLVLPKLKNLKGATSDKDIAFIKAAATSLDTGMSEASFKKTLQDMGGVLNKYDASGNPIGGASKTTAPTTSTTRSKYKSR